MSEALRIHSLPSTIHIQRCMPNETCERFEKLCFLKLGSVIAEKVLNKRSGARPLIFYGCKYLLTDFNLKASMIGIQKIHGSVRFAPPHLLFRLRRQWC